MKTIYDGDVEASSLSFSNDDKQIYIAGQGLKILDLTTSNIFVAFSFGSFLGFQFNSHNNDFLYLYFGGGISKYKTNSSTEILDPPQFNIFELVIKPEQDSIELKFKLENSCLIQSNLININGILIKQLENKTFESGTYDVNFNINNLPNGAYFIQIQLNGDNYPQTLNFVKGK